MVVATEKKGKGLSHPTHPTPKSRQWCPARPGGSQPGMVPVAHARYSGRSRQDFDLLTSAQVPKKIIEPFIWLLEVSRHINITKKSHLFFKKKIAYSSLQLSELSVPVKFHINEKKVGNPCSKQRPLGVKQWEQFLHPSFPGAKILAWHYYFFSLFLSLSNQPVLRLQGQDALLRLYCYHFWPNSPATMYTQPATVVCKNGSSVGTCTRCTHIFARLATICTLSR